MAKRRSSVRKREREIVKRQRELKKSQRAADKRERRVERDQQASSAPSEGTVVAIDQGENGLCDSMVSGELGITEAGMSRQA
jgi:hypothetical protein